MWATAVLNALAVLGIHFDTETVNSAVGTRLRDLRLEASLTEYLYSRHNAGATHADLIKGIELLAGDTVTAGFIPYSKDISVPFIDYCAELLRCHKALILTMNLQLLPTAPGERIHDAWHHQMAFGADTERGLLFLTNPLEAQSAAALELVLSSASELLIHEEDVFTRLRPDDDLEAIARDLDAISPAWAQLQVGKQLRELSATRQKPLREHRYLRIPAAYATGLTVVARKVL